MIFHSSEKKARLMLWTTALIWGGGFVAGKMALTGLSPWGVLFWRFGLAALLFLLPFHKAIMGQGRRVLAFGILSGVLLALSLAVQYYAEPYIVANVPPNCFMPRPKVGSAVIKLTRYEKPPVDVKDEGLMFRLIRASFNQRRKTLVNGIRNSGDFSLSKEEIEDVFNRCDLPLNIRGEALTLEQFAMLANCIYDEKN